MTRSAVTDGFVSQYPQPWQGAGPTKRGMAVVPLYGREAADPHYIDLDNGGGALADVHVACLPDKGVAYVIDDITFSVRKAIAKGAGAAPSIAVGVYALNGTKAAPGVAVDDADYLLAAYSLADGAIGTEQSISNGDAAWHTGVAATEAQRTLIGPVIIRLTSVLAAAGGATGEVYAHVRYHVANTGLTAKTYPELVAEPAVI